jgi:ABC-type Fe3+ transport system permease subunit
MATAIRHSLAAAALAALVAVVLTTPGLAAFVRSAQKVN